MEELKVLPKVLQKYSKVIEKVEYLKRTKDSKDHGYTITLNKEYTINGKSEKVIKATTVKEARKIIRSNKLLSTVKEDK